MYHPLVTIIIPVYKGEIFVGKAIESVLSQTYDNIEILVINDGSPDNGLTRSAVAPYFDKVIYIEKENGGVSSVLNLAFKEMYGEWLSWLSHDDLYYPNKVKRQIDYINNNNISDFNNTVIFSDFDFIDEYGKKLKIPTKNQIKPTMKTEELILTNIKRNSFGGCTFLIPRNAYYKIGGFSEKLRTISDFDYWYRLLFSGYKFYYIPEILTSNRMHSQQVTYKTTDLAKSESEIFHKNVIMQLIQHEKYCNVENLLKIAHYMNCKGIKHIPELAYNCVMKYRKDKFIKIYILMNKITAKLYYFCKSIAKSFYIKHVIFRNTIRKENYLN